MEKKNNKYVVLSLIIILTLLCFVAFFMLYSFIPELSKSTADKNTNAESRSYHIIVTGSSENELFLHQVYDGACNYSDHFNAVVELYVPGSQAEDVSMQSLFDYASFVNADCVIAYIDSTNISFQVPRRIDDTVIPLVTTGQYDSNLQQISFIGNSYWELGRIIGYEIKAFLHGNGNAIIINNEISTNYNYSALMNSIQDSLRNQKDIKYSVVNEFSPQELISKPNQQMLIVCITEEDTIKIAQELRELKLNDNKNINIIGFGANETCQLYLKKGVISELISLDPEKIGETAIREFFEYITKGYANSYIAADVKISRSGE